MLRYDDGRLLPQTFRGAMLVSREIEGLGLQAGQYRAVSLRNSSDMQDLAAQPGCAGCDLGPIQLRGG